MLLGPELGHETLIGSGGIQVESGTHVKMHINGSQGIAFHVQMHTNGALGSGLHVKMHTNGSQGSSGDCAPFKNAYKWRPGE